MHGTIPNVAQQLKAQASRDEATRFPVETSIGHHFFKRLPRVVQEDIEHQLIKRKQRKNPDRENLERFTVDVVRHALKWAPCIEDKFPFSDTRKHAKPRPVVSSETRPYIQLDHFTLTSDQALERLALNLTEVFTYDIHRIELDESYLSALDTAYQAIGTQMKAVCLEPPKVEIVDQMPQEDCEREYESAIRRCLDVRYLLRKLMYLRNQYIEFSQIALDRVGGKKAQRRYVSSRSFTLWRRKQVEAEHYVQSMVVMSEDTDTVFDLEEVVKRTTANHENRRIELVVRSRGDEERAIDLGYEGIFITWTLPGKYHRRSKQWIGCTPKEAHANLMEQWKRARALFKKHDIDWFGLRVAEPHKDGTPHAHLFLYCPKSQLEELVAICRHIATEEDHDELKTDALKKKRFDAKQCDPSKGTATGYIIKYISKNINGAHMPEKGADENALSARAWASIHRIKQFSQSGAPAVGLWRQLRRAKPLDTAFDEELDALRDHADHSRWKGFCELGVKARLAYEDRFNQYGEKTKRVIGFQWFGKLVETCSEHFRLVKKSELKRLQEARRASPWSTENKCNPQKNRPISPLEKALMELTGWSCRGVQCLLKPLALGATVPIDKTLKIRLRHNRLCVSGGDP
ncbi:replication endonuclease [Vibrio europaeus]|uniref:replication endonuclease n=1 Tax=Vibrio europaeus TaxID=300876 RepID=UPI0023401411|nr:replication endonuclease [Vibrio europaeus]MDC5850897.1 replication endonuclease [Vibrio europaeus]